MTIHSDIPIEDQLKRVLDRLAIVVGLFGTRGWAEMTVVEDDGLARRLPVTKDVNDRIVYARKVLGEFDRKPITLE